MGACALLANDACCCIADDDDGGAIDDANDAGELEPALLLAVEDDAAAFVYALRVFMVMM